MSLTSIVIPTYRRPEMAAACAETLLSSASGIEPVFVVDECQRTLELLRGLPVRIVFNSKKTSAIQAWNDGLAVSKGDYLVLGADDLRFRKGWLEHALRAHADALGGSGLVGLNDLHNDGLVHATHYLFDRAFCARVLGGVLAYPCYKYYFNDTEANGRARQAGRYSYCPEAVVEHLHPSNGKRPADEFDRSNSDAFAHDMELFYKRQAAGFPDDFSRVLP